MVKLCGAALGFLAFGVTIILGLAAGNPDEITLLRAVKAMVIFCLIGLALGWVAYRVLDEHAVRKNKELFSELEGDEESSSLDDTGDKNQPTSDTRGRAMAETSQAIAEK